MIFNCKRCGHIEKHKGNFLKHLNRKIVCKPILKDIDIEVLKQEVEIKVNKVNIEVNNVVNNVVNKDNNKFECRYCNKIFSHKQSKYLHESKYCKEKLIKQDEVIKESSKISELQEQLAEKDAEMAKKDQLMKEQIDFMKKQIEILMKKAGNNTTNTDNSIDNSITDNSITDNSITDNKQIHININGFGKEDLSYLTDRYFRDLFNIPFSAITTLVEDIHFNPKKPQNWNAKIPDDKTSKALIYNAEKKMWVKREKKEVINDMVEKSYNMLDANFEIQKEAKTLDEKGKRKFENFMKVYDKGDKQLDKRYETEIREKLINFKEYHIEK